MWSYKLPPCNKYAVYIYIYINVKALKVMEQQSSKMTAHQKLLEGVLNCRLMDPTSSFWFSAPEVAPKLSLLKSSQMMLVQLVCGLHSENQCSRIQVSKHVSLKPHYFKPVKHSVFLWLAFISKQLARICS